MDPIAPKTNPSGFSYLPLRWLALTVLFLSVLVVAGVRTRLLDFPLERDEGEYAYIGQLILEGVPPYQLAGNMKMPGIYLGYAAIMAAFGQTVWGIHLGLLVMNLAIMTVLFAVARNLLDLYGAVTATAAYGLMLLSPAYLGLAAHAAHFVVLPVLLGVWVLFRIQRGGGLLACLASGLLFGVAFIMNQPGVFFGLWGGLYLVWISISGRRVWRRTLARVGIYSLGCVAPFLAVCAWMKIAGVFPQFWYWIFTYSREYGTAESFNAFLIDAPQTLEGIFHSTFLTYLCAGLGLSFLCFRWLELNTRVFLAGFLVFSFFAVCPGFYFRPHYFIVLAPAIALLAGVGVSLGSRKLAQDFNRPLWYHVSFLLGVLACAQSLYADRLVLFSLSPDEACRAVYGLNPFPESLEIARYIEQNSTKDQRVFVVGDEPEIYFYSHRRSSNTQIYPSQTMDPRPYAHKMQEKMISEVERNPPEFIVYSSIDASLLRRSDSDPLLINWGMKYERNNMRIVGLIQLADQQASEAVWGSAAETTSVYSPYFVAVYQRSVPGNKH
jgi:hypothetical protein